MDSLKNGLIAAVIALVVALGVGVITRPNIPGNILTDAGQSFGATVATVNAAVYSHLTNLQVNQNLGVVGNFFQGGTATGTHLETQVTIGSCVTGTSTIFAVQNPFSATSTITQFTISGTQGATTSELIVATSTTPSPAMPVTATSSLGANIMNAAAISTSSQFYSVAGFPAGPGKGYTNPKGIPSSSSNIETVIGPAEYILGFSTSTSGGASTGGINGATTTVGVATPASCTYKIEWQN